MKSNASVKSNVQSHLQGPIQFYNKLKMFHFLAMLENLKQTTTETTD